MAPELFLEKFLLRSAFVKDLKKADMWSFEMIIFGLLNPDIRYPYGVEIRGIREILICKGTSELSKELNPPMAEGGEEGVDATLPTSFSRFSQEWEELLFQTKFLAVVSSLGHLFIKKFSDRTNRLHSKTRQREVCWGSGWSGNHPHGLFLTYFSNHEDDIQS